MVLSMTAYLLRACVLPVRVYTRAELLVSGAMQSTETNYLSTDDANCLLAG